MTGHQIPGGTAGFVDGGGFIAMGMTADIKRVGNCAMERTYRM